MREVQKERTRLVLFDESHRLIGVPLGQCVLIGWPFDNLCPLHQGDVVVLDLRVVRRVLAHLGHVSRPPGFIHVVRIRDSEIAIEALFGRKVPRKMSQMPFADDPRGVSDLLEHLCECDFLGPEPTPRVGEQHRTLGAGHPIANRITSGHQRRSARGTHRRGHIKLRPFLPLGCHPIEIRSADRRIAETAQIPPS